MAFYFHDVVVPKFADVAVPILCHNTDIMCWLLISKLFCDWPTSSWACVSFYADSEATSIQFVCVCSLLISVFLCLCCISMSIYCVFVILFFCIHCLFSSAMDLFSVWGKSLFLYYAGEFKYHFTHCTNNIMLARLANVSTWKWLDVLVLGCMTDIHCIDTPSLYAIISAISLLLGSSS